MSINNVPSRKKKRQSGAMKDSRFVASLMADIDRERKVAPLDSVGEGGGEQQTKADVRRC